jgi:hypothetical protein
MCNVCAGTGDPGTGKPCICGGRGTQTAELQGFRERVYELEADAERYNELIMAVENKYPGETRHETALRYIREAETSNNGPAQEEFEKVIY